MLEIKLNFHHRRGFSVISVEKIVNDMKRLNYYLHECVIKWKHFPRNWPFVAGTTGHRWIPLTKVSDAEL